MPIFAGRARSRKPSLSQPQTAGARAAIRVACGATTSRRPGAWPGQASDARKARPRPGRGEARWRGVFSRPSALGVVARPAGRGGLRRWCSRRPPPTTPPSCRRSTGCSTRARAARSRCVDRSGEVFAWRGQQLGVTRAEAVSPHLVNAILATEDRRFYWHFGIDLRGTARAALVNLRAGETVQGGSSITQQVAKLVFFDNTRTLERKIKEVPAALALEWKFSKDEILSIYLNRAYLGAGATGFEAAAQRYFGKSAAEVNPAEAAMLAGLLRAPSRFAPTNDLARAQDRRGDHRRADAGAGLPHRRRRRRRRWRSPAVLSKAAAARAGGAFADWVMSLGPGLPDPQHHRGRRGPDHLRPARSSAPPRRRCAHVFETKLKPGSNAQAAIVVMSPDGAVRAMVGGRRARRRRGPVQPRHPGAAPDRLAVQALRLRRGAAGRGEPARPGPRRAADALRPGLGRLVAAELHPRLSAAGSPSPRRWPIRSTPPRCGSRRPPGASGCGRWRRTSGSTAPIADGPALALGVSEATLLEMTGAYAGILNGGVRALPYGMRELRLQADGTRADGRRRGARRSGCSTSARRAS